MLTLSTTQATMVALESKIVKWVFYIYDKNGVGYSFVTEPMGGAAWATGITWDSGITWDDGNNLSNIILTDFGGITLNRNLAENTIIAPSEVTFTISNQDSVLDFLDFKGGTVQIDLYISDGSSDIKITGWKFRIKTANPGYQNLKITAQDFLQYYLTGYYPNTRLPEDIFPSDRTYSSDGLCVPVPFGTAYIPLRDVFISSYGGFIMLGDPLLTYTISAIRSPREWGLKTEYLSTSYTFTQSTKADADSVNWRVFQAIIADSDNNGTADAAGFWGTPGGNILDPPVKFTRSDTATMTNPADVIAFVLKDFGIPVAYIDESVSFAAAHTIFDAWGLTFNGAFWYKQDREKVLASLLNQCHAYLSVGEKIELHILSKTSRKTITGAEVLRTSDQGEGSFSYSDIVNTDLSDSGYVSWQTADESQDQFIKTLVAVDAVANVISSDVLEVPFVQDSEDIKRIGILHYERKYLKEAEASFTAKGTCLALQPDDVITFNADNYGGTYTVNIDSVKINKDLSMDITTSKYSSVFRDWEDLSVVPLVVPTDNTDNSWKPVISGPDDGVNTNVLPGRIRIGQTSNHIVLDPTDPLRISLFVGGTEKIRLGNLNQFLTYVTNAYGIGIGDTTKYLSYDVVNGLKIKGSITADSYAELRQSYCFTWDDSLDSAYPLEVPFRIVSETLAIVSVKISFKIMPFRAYSTGAASGGGQTSSSGGGQTTSSGGSGNTNSSGPAGDFSNTGTINYGDERTTSSGNFKSGTISSSSVNCAGTTHYHTVNWSDLLYHDHEIPQHRHDLDSASNVHYHTITLLAHTHTVSDHTHTVSDHIHSLVFGLYEESNSPTVHFHVDNGSGYGTASSSYTTAQADLDITSQISGTGWKNVKFEATARCRLSIIIECKVDITA